MAASIGALGREGVPSLAALESPPSADAATPATASTSAAGLAAVPTNGPLMKALSIPPASLLAPVRPPPPPLWRLSAALLFLASLTFIRQSTICMMQPKQNI